ncbi:MAG TPA: methyltransferase domain-containing protein [Solirubrobacteraceae bacterium]|nr:methyltransferase domain-containing protein [Solirubrobacteraceae bacterium]
MSSPGSLDFYDTELRAHHEHLRAAYRIRPGDEVVDIGCGTGLTTREAARAAAPGRVVGVDVSERMLERARQVTAAERLDNVRYELGDAQMHRFDSAGFDVAISRFGTMFFSDPAAAFANIAAALRPGAPLVLLVWQRYEDNEWARAIDGALADAAQPAQPAADRSRSAMRKRPRASLRAPAFTTCTSRTSTNRSSTDTTSMPRSRSCWGFGTRGRLW